MNKTLERFEDEFFRLAGAFLRARYSLLHIEADPNGDDCGRYCGMVDSAFEMKLLCEEEIKKK